MVASSGTLLGYRRIAGYGRANHHLRVPTPHGKIVSSSMALEFLRCNYQGVTFQRVRLYVA